MTQPRISYEGHRPYRGIIKVGKEIVWASDHWHDNRDQGSSARNCAARVLDFATHPETCDKLRKWWHTNSERVAGDKAHDLWAIEQGNLLRERLSSVQPVA